MSKVWNTWVEAHYKSFTMYYGYLVGISTAAQMSISDLNDYIPVNLRHGVIGAATILLFIDKLRRSAKAVGAATGA